MRPLTPEIERLIGEFFIPRHVDSNDIQQHEYEIRVLLEMMIYDLKPVNTVEIGTYKGFMAALLSLATSGKTVSIDIVDHGRIMDGRNLEMILADATQQATADKVKEILAGPIDFLFIDDGHFYDQIVKEFQVWTPLVRPGGWICFHDINPLANIGPHGVQPPEIQVPRFWKELQGDRVEIIATGNEGHYRGHLPHGGLGILRL